MKSHSNNKNSKRLNFFDLIDKEISFDYLLGVYVCVFRREKWNQNLHLINKKLISDPRLWSNFENTCFFLLKFFVVHLKTR